MTRILLTGLIVLSSFAGFGRGLESLEDSIVAHRALALESTDSATALFHNKRVAFFVERALRRNEASEYGFSKLKTLTVFRSDDQRLMGIFWNLDVPDLGVIYQGIFRVQVKRKKVRLYPVQSAPNGFHPGPEDRIDGDAWYGAIYYNAVSFKINGRRKFALLGWRQKDRLNQSKIIDIVSFDKRSWLMNHQLLIKGGGSTKRVVIDYPNSLVCALKFDADRGIIYYDRLMQREATFGSNPAGYTTSFIFDGFELKRGLWHFREDIEVMQPDE